MLSVINVFEDEGRMLPSSLGLRRAGHLRAKEAQAQIEPYCL